MPYQSIHCRTFIFEEIRGQIICAGNLPIHLCFDPKRHEMAKQWLIKAHGVACLANNTDRHYFVDLLAEFFKGSRRGFPPQVNSPFVEKGTEFQRRVWKGIAEIPYGKTKTYGELAQALGSPGAARAVGQACNANPLALIVPCHRVIGASGLGGFSGGCAMKQALLRLEQRNTEKDTAGFTNRP